MEPSASGRFAPAARTFALRRYDRIVGLALRWKH